jgi:hypothetical protein
MRAPEGWTPPPLRPRINKPSDMPFRLIVLALYAGVLFAVAFFK